MISLRIINWKSGPYERRNQPIQEFYGKVDSNTDEGFRLFDEGFRLFHDEMRAVLSKSVNISHPADKAFFMAHISYGDTETVVLYGCLNEGSYSKNE